MFLFLILVRKPPAICNPKKKRSLAKEEKKKEQNKNGWRQVTRKGSANQALGEDEEVVGFLEPSTAPIPRPARQTIRPSRHPGPASRADVVQRSYTIHTPHKHSSLREPWEHLPRLKAEGIQHPQWTSRSEPGAAKQAQVLLRPGDADRPSSIDPTPHTALEHPVRDPPDCRPAQLIGQRSSDKISYGFVFARLRSLSFGLGAARVSALHKGTRNVGNLHSICPIG